MAQGTLGVSLRLTDGDLGYFSGTYRYDPEQVFGGTLTLSAPTIWCVDSACFHYEAHCDTNKDHGDKCRSSKD